MILRRVDLESLDLDSRSLRSTGDVTAAGWAVSSLDICLGWGVEDVELERTESDFSCAHAHDHLSLSAMPVVAAAAMCLANRFRCGRLCRALRNSPEQCTELHAEGCMTYLPLRRMARKCFSQ